MLANFKHGNEIRLTVSVILQEIVLSDYIVLLPDVVVEVLILEHADCTLNERVAALLLLRFDNLEVLPLDILKDWHLVELFLEAVEPLFTELLI